MFPKGSTLKHPSDRQTPIFYIHGSPEGNTAPPRVTSGTHFHLPEMSPSHTTLSKSTNTHMHTASQRVMDLSPYAPLLDRNKAFHACSLHLFGP